VPFGASRTSLQSHLDEFIWSSNPRKHVVEGDGELSRSRFAAIRVSLTIFRGSRSSDGRTPGRTPSPFEAACEDDYPFSMMRAQFRPFGWVIRDDPSRERLFGIRWTHGAQWVQQRGDFVT
jgi:hypothetical protein